MRMSGLPRFLRRSRGVVSAASGLSARSAGARRVLALAARRPRPRRKIGVSWAGGTRTTGKARRSTTLEDWLPVLRVPGVHYVSLQYTDCRADLARLREQHGIGLVHWQEAIDDYDETAALVTALDAVASVCTAVIHLAGALGRPTYVLVPWWPGWRYLFEGEERPGIPPRGSCGRSRTTGACLSPASWPSSRAALVAERHLDQDQARHGLAVLLARGEARLCGPRAQPARTRRAARHGRPAGRRASRPPDMNN